MGIALLRAWPVIPDRRLLRKQEAQSSQRNLRDVAIGSLKRLGDLLVERRPGGERLELENPRPVVPLPFLLRVTRDRPRQASASTSWRAPT